MDGGAVGYFSVYAFQVKMPGTLLSLPPYECLRCGRRGMEVFRARPSGVGVRCGGWVGRLPGLLPSNGSI